MAPTPDCRRHAATPRLLEPAWHRAARRQRAQDRALVFFAKASQRLEAHHGSQAGMSWQTADGHGKSSLSAWLQAQGFIDTVTSAVRKGELDKPDVERLKQLRVDARGDGGVLSHAQKRSVKPQQVSLRRGKLVYFQVAPPVGEGRTAKETDQPHSEILSLQFGVCACARAAAVVAVVVVVVVVVVVAVAVAVAVAVVVVQ